MTDRIRIYSRIMMAVYIAAVLFLCLANFSDTPDVPKSLFGIPTDKFVHFLMYVPFVPLFALSFRSENRGWKALCLGFVLALAFGGVIELLQGMTSYRSAEAADLLADGLGVAFGLGLTYIGLLIIKNRSYENN